MGFVIGTAIWALVHRKNERYGVAVLTGNRLIAVLGDGREIRTPGEKVDVAPSAVHVESATDRWKVLRLNPLRQGREPRIERVSSRPITGWPAVDFDTLHKELRP